MSRLIDADKLKKHYAWWKDEERELLDAIVDIQPTAYDVKNIIKRLEAEMNEAKKCGVAYDYNMGMADAFEFAIEIVKGIAQDREE